MYLLVESISFPSLSVLSCVPVVEMGLISSCTKTGEHVVDSYRTQNIYSSEVRVKRWEGLFDSLKLSEYDVGKLYKTFKKIDKRQMEYVHVKECLEYFEIRATEFASRTFSAYLNVDSHSLGFKEFVITIWNICTIHHDCLGEYGLFLSSTHLSFPLIMRAVDYVFYIYDDDNR